MSITKSLIKSLKMMGKRLPLYLLAIVMMTALGALFEVTGSVFMKIVFDCAGKGNVTESKTAMIITIVAGVATIALSSVFMCVYNNEAKRMTLKLKILVFEKSMRFPVTYYEKHHSGEILSKLLYDTDMASNIFSARLRRVMAPIISVTVFAIAMMIINPFMTIVLIVFNVLLFLINTLLSKPMKKVAKRLSEKNMLMTNVLSNMIAGAAISKIYDTNHTGVLKYEKINDEYTAAQRVRMRLGALLETLNGGFDLLCALMFIVIGIIFVGQGLSTIGEVAAIYTLYTSLSWKFLQLGKNFPELVNRIAYAERIFDFLALPEENKEPVSDFGMQQLKSNSKDESGFETESKSEAEFGFGQDGFRHETENENAIEYRDIVFGYQDKEKLFNNATYEFPANKLIALTGPSGCGKSTLAKLLLGFYTIESGDVFLYGKSINELGLSKVRALIAYVPQEPYMYNVSIMDNIRYARAGASEQEVIEAAKLANAHGFISRLENGYNTILINRGNSLSGGERQRIAIARAILKDAPIILMDEATSALDNESEKMVADAINELKSKKTVIMIAHRQTTIRMADVVKVIT